MKQTKQKAARGEVSLPFRPSRLASHPFHDKGEAVLNLGIDSLHLQPRDELEQLRRASLFHPQPAGNTQNEQHARAQLHARNEADSGACAGDAANDPDEGSADGRIDTHWTRILHYDVFGADDSPATGVRAMIAQLLRAFARWPHVDE